ncbi:precorrin-2 dehydrogenase/sirohydrochlorin ferrochelatase family protein [Parablautia sp. Marseille-Q6255]|uniref:precorrin-2 dehydrogenase/sirohydrochlorin ferrochelatase family protein n=1 Tax=Parablautia sp. Marseille-Q6255 TaxID=3039593 RepID=UPI0024BC5CD0|nr:bifunctional precorrin-2 dehydrogenase/sirohydrochlorin ferrochelatase [Parablautia sp. Marseille-Q6255]
MSEKRKHYFPMFVDLTDKKVVVAGAGTIAKRRIRALAEFTDRLVVVAPEVNQELKEMEARGKLTILKKHCEREDLYDAALVIAATNDNKINQEIYSVCKCLGIPVNVCADKTKCDFYFPGIVTDENFVVGISTSGREHKKAREVTDKIQALLAQEE